MEEKEPLEGEQQQPSAQEQPDHTYYTDLVAKAETIKAMTDWQLGALEFENLRIKWGEGPAIDDEEKKELFAKVLEAQKEFSEARKAYYEKQNERKAANLEKREGLLKRLTELVEQKKWGQFNEVASIQRKFEDIRPLPPEAEAQNAAFNTLLEEFEKHKVEHLVKLREKEEENLLGKLAILDKIKAVVEGISETTKDWDNLDKQVEDLATQWKKVGRVAKEKSDEIWDQYKSARDAFTAKKMEFNSAFKAELEKNIKAKEGIIAKAESLLEETDLAVASKEMNILHRRWRDSGPVPKEQSDELWSKFKEVFEKFDVIRDENIDVIRAAEQENYDAKVALCERAEALAEDESSINQKDLIEKLYNEWNNLGPVPKRKTKTIWKRFKKAIDTLQKSRRNHYKQLRFEQKENLQRKREITEKITSLAEAENKEEALAEVKALQQEFGEIGFVPIKFKNKAWDEYRAACDTFFNALRSSNKGGAATGGGGTRSSAPVSENRQMQNEIFRLRKEADKINETILQYSDTKTYIKPNKSGMALRDELQAKIDKAQEDLDAKNAEIEKIKRTMEDMDKAD
ncbi:MAG: DUF349 domain-containing protein [Balneolales bacterium]|nr:DUF349 domain-containing protein [Balneolales bacterium]